MNVFDPSQDRIDAMLLRKTCALRDGIRSGSINPLRAESILQQIIEGNTPADLFFRSVWTTLKKPSLSQIGNLLERDDYSYQDGMDPKLLTILEKMDWNEGSDEVDLTLVTMKNLFIRNTEPETEEIIVETAQKQGLQTCPDWIVPALALYSEQNQQKGKESNVRCNLCLSNKKKRDAGFAILLLRKWYIYRRSVDKTCPWSSPVTWLFVKPKIIVQD